MNQTAQPSETQRLITLLRVVGGLVLLALVITGMGLLVEHEAAGSAPSADLSIRDVINHYGYLVGFALIYIEESGVPLFIPGDAFLIYVGHRLPHEVLIMVAAWLGFTLAVTLGATNLYLLARRYGRRLLQHRIASFLHLTPERLDLAEREFKTWGPWALIVGRHIPGLRLPLTVAAGILNLRYPVFAISVAVSSSAWAALFLLLGAIYGDRIEHSIRSSPLLYGSVLIAVIVIAAVVIVWRRRGASHD